MEYYRSPLLSNHVVAAVVAGHTVEAVEHTVEAAGNTVEVAGNTVGAADHTVEYIVVEVVDNLKKKQYLLEGYLSVTKVTVGLHCYLLYLILNFLENNYTEIIFPLTILDLYLEPLN
ncbi:unnamed protein product [[Candida] boidinii]|nr:unnamed protein product [[Candida] boidinii]